MEHLLLVGGQVNYTVRDDDVYRSIWNGKVLDFSQTEVRIAEIAFSGIVACSADHFWCHINPDDFTRIPHLPGG
ncbi:hypothetical protein D3C71_2098770 [compost metagenome]